MKKSWWIFLCLGIGILTFATVYIGFKAKTELLQKGLAYHQTAHLQIAVALSKGIEMFLSQVVQRISVLAEYPELLQIEAAAYFSSENSATIRRNLEKCHEKIADKVEEIAILDHKGIVRYLMPHDTKKIGTNYSYLPLVAQVMQNQLPVVHRPRFASKDKISLMTVYPVYSTTGDKTILKAIIATQIPFKSIERYCLHPITLQGHAVWIISKDKVILSHTDRQYVGQILENPNTAETPKATQENLLNNEVYLSDIVSGNMGSGIYRNSWNKREVVAYVPIVSRHEERMTFQSSHKATVVVSILLQQIRDEIYWEWRQWLVYIFIILIVAYTIFVLLYVTVQKKIRLEREKQFQDRLLRAEKLSSLNQLALGVAHEINNPLAVIGGYAEALLRRTQKLVAFAAEEYQEFPEYLHIICEQIFRCKDICQRLLNFAHEEKAGFQPANICKIVEDTLLLLRKTAEKSRVTLINDLGQDLPLVTGDQGRLRQLFFNLIINAIEHKTNFPDRQASVSIRASVQMPYLRIDVSDNGQGIPQRLQKKIFEPFFTTKPVGRGTGLGLCIVQQIVERHHGRIGLQSKEGDGTTFTVELPLAKEEI